MIKKAREGGRDSCSKAEAIKNTQSKRGLDDGGICVYLSTAAGWKMSAEVRGFEGLVY